MHKIELDHVIKKYRGGVLALNDISFQISEGSTTGLVGPNGAGKTTMVNILSGLIKVTKGMVAVCGFNPQKREKEMKMQVSVVFEDPIFFENLYVQEHLELINVLYEMDSKQSVLDIMKKWDIEKYRKKRLSTLSKGNRKRVAIATAFMREFSVSILDEPFKELDIYGRQLLEEEINIYKKQGKTILITSHEMGQLERCCDEIALIKDGKLLDKKWFCKLFC